jgi:hypothetical protein
MTAWNVSDAIKIDVSGPENGIYLLDTTGVGSVRIKAADDGGVGQSFVFPDSQGETGQVALTVPVGVSGPPYKLAWSSTLPTPTYDTWVFKDVKSTGVSGGGFFSGSWITRELNTTEGVGSDAALLGNNIVLQPGVWSITAISPSYNVNLSSSRLYDITHATTWGYSTPGSSSTNTSGQSNSVNNTINLINVVTEETHIEIQQRCSVDNVVDGLGTPSNILGYSEVYTIVTVVKIA